MVQTCSCDQYLIQQDITGVPQLHKTAVLCNCGPVSPIRVTEDPLQAGVTNSSMPSFGQPTCNSNYIYAAQLQQLQPYQGTPVFEIFKMLSKHEHRKVGILPGPQNDRAPSEPNVFTDGSATFLTMPGVALASVGIWWPDRDITQSQRE